MPVFEFAPHQLLSPYMLGFSYTERAFAPPHDTFDILPDSMIELVWSFGLPCSIALAGQERLLPPCYAVGLLDAPAQLRARGVLRAIRARFYPWGLLPLLGDLLAPAAPGLRGLLVAGPELLGLGRELADALLGGPDRAIAELQQFLLGRAIQARFGDPTVVAAARQILVRRGDLSIDELARASFASPRALRRRFQSSLGAGPKALARAARFEHVRALLWEDPDAELSAVALAAGYADQAHMQREFRQFSQRTPRVFAEEMRQVRRLFGAPGGRNLQDS